MTIRPFPFWRPFGVEQDVGLMAMAALARGDGGEFGSEVECLRKVFVIWVQRSHQGWKITGSLDVTLQQHKTWLLLT